MNAADSSLYSWTSVCPAGSSTYSWIALTDDASTLCDSPFDSSDDTCKHMEWRTGATAYQIPLTALSIGGDSTTFFYYVEETTKNYIPVLQSNTYDFSAMIARGDTTY